MIYVLTRWAMRSDVVTRPNSYLLQQIITSELGIAVLVSLIARYYDLTLYPWVLAGIPCTSLYTYVLFVFQDGVYSTVMFERAYRDLMIQYSYVAQLVEVRAFQILHRVLRSALELSFSTIIPNSNDTIIIVLCCGVYMLDRHVERAVTKSLIITAGETVRFLEKLVLDCFSLLELNFTLVTGSSKDVLSSQLPHYRYETLTEGEIRLLLLPRQPSSSPVRIKIVTVKLREAPPYEAISYTWGTSKQTRQIMLNGAGFNTTIAAYEVIHGRRSIWRSRFIWIDSICINQDDLDEKATQVAQMTDVYRNADKVVVWLSGSAFNVSTFMALDMMHLLLLAPMKGRSNLDICQYLASSRDNAKWEAFVRIWSHAWFTRIWIVQEVSVAQNVFFSYGGVLITWDYVTYLSSMFQSFNQLGLFITSHQASTAYRNFDKLATINQLRQIVDHNKVANEQMPTRTTQTIDDSSVQNPVTHSTTYGPNTLYNHSSTNHKTQTRDGTNRFVRLSFPHMLTMYGRFDATDARDKVFALRGLVNDPLPSVIEPNYVKSVESLYIDLAKAIWTSSEPFGVVGWAGIGRQRALALPSFVPDWTCPPTMTSTPLTAACYRHEEIGMQYKASGNTKPEVRIASTRSRSSIDFAGVAMDRVKMVCAAYPLQVESVASERSLEARRLQNQAIVSWHDDIRAMGAKYIDRSRQNDFNEMFWRTLICDRKFAIRPAPLELGEEYDLWIRTTRKALAMADMLKKNVEPTPADVELLKKNSDLSIVRQMSGYFGLRFCVTERGRIGMFADQTQAGDLVCVAYGAATPWTLRPTSTTERATSKDSQKAEHEDYHLVGECYIHGIMDGESIGNEHQVSRFRLC